MFEGVLALYSDSLNKMAELKIYVDTSIQQCFARRLERDQKTRGRSVQSIKFQWNESVMPMYQQYVKHRR
ncbi:MAG: hypothetical protein MJ195_01710 [Mycoplasmoidaceae bacterium]|nr:hypothetical protein [Mycoplasmoidaceae bacterium]